ncbi:hypothetical protein KP78_28450 [Jeotgalibacillus soli]|uniref:Uncharacterized protein n=1 Tax=Jeotgalibacillus soli TaxID=889306 RepID=A0A0C2VLG0_9BACL|nr:hypothetical protein KP78_28450 [Jeotgalibacillus soli]
MNFSLKSIAIRRNFTKKLLNFVSSFFIFSGTSIKIKIYGYLA